MHGYDDPCRLEQQVTRRRGDHKSMDRLSYFASSDFVRIWIRIPLNVNSDPHADRLAMDLHLTVGRVQHSIARAPNEYSTASAF